MSKQILNEMIKRQDRHARDNRIMDHVQRTEIIWGLLVRLDIVDINEDKMFFMMWGYCKKLENR